MKKAFVFDDDRKLVFDDTENVGRLYSTGEIQALRDEKSSLEAQVAEKLAYTYVVRQALEATGDQALVDQTEQIWRTTPDARFCDMAIARVNEIGELLAILEVAR